MTALAVSLNSGCVTRWDISAIESLRRPAARMAGKCAAQGKTVTASVQLLKVTRMAPRRTASCKATTCSVCEAASHASSAIADGPCSGRRPARWKAALRSFSKADRSSCSSRTRRWYAHDAAPVNSGGLNTSASSDCTDISVRPSLTDPAHGVGYGQLTAWHGTWFRQPGPATAPAHQAARLSQDFSFRLRRLI